MHVNQIYAVLYLFCTAEKWNSGQEYIEFLLTSTVNFVDGYQVSL